MAHIDLSSFEQVNLSFEKRFVFNRPGRIRGLAGWFRAHLGADQVIDTHPSQPETHWRQAWLPFEKHADVGITDILDLKINVKGHQERVDDTVIQWDWFCSQI